MKLSLWLRTLRMLFAVADDKSRPVETLERAEAAVRIVEDTVDEIKREAESSKEAASPIGEVEPDPPLARAPAASPPAGSAADPAADPPPQARP